jgi:hypothetical protein
LIGFFKACSKIKTQVKIYILKRNLVETMGMMELNERLLGNAKQDLMKQAGKHHMTTNELTGMVAYYEKELVRARQQIPRMQEELRRLQNK